MQHDYDTETVFGDLSPAANIKVSILKMAHGMLNETIIL